MRNFRNADSILLTALLLWPASCKSNIYSLKH